MLRDVANAYGLDVNEVLNRHNNREAYRAGVFLLRRACSLSLKDVAKRADISPARVSQIQKQVGDEGLIPSLKSYKVTQLWGLAIVKELVELHGGSLSLSNISPHGLRVEFTLPKSLDPQV